jgi:hypothetical protein
MNQSLLDLYLRKVCSLEDCMARSSEQDELKTMILAAGGSLGTLAPPPNHRR